MWFGIHRPLIMRVEMWPSSLTITILSLREKLCAEDSLIILCGPTVHLIHYITTCEWALETAARSASVRMPCGYAQCM